jgi:hypothetical protein
MCTFDHALKMEPKLAIKLTPYQRNFQLAYCIIKIF